MTKERFNKNGIRILDGPKLPRSKRSCIPGEHCWQLIKENDIQLRRAIKLEYVCRLCGETLSEMKLYGDLDEF